MHFQSAATGSQNKNVLLLTLSWKVNRSISSPFHTRNKFSLPFDHQYIGNIPALLVVGVLIYPNLCSSQRFMLTGFFYNYDINTLVSFVVLLLSWCHSFLIDLFLLLTSHVCHFFRWFSPHASLCAIPCTLFFVVVATCCHSLSNLSMFQLHLFLDLKITGRNRNDSLEVTTIDKAYFSGLCKGIYPQNMA